MKDHEIESLLARLPASPPSAALLARVEHDLDLDTQWLAPPRHTPVARWLPPLGWATLGAAAAFAVMALQPSISPPRPAAPLAAAPSNPSILPVTAVREMVSAQNQGIRYNSRSKQPEHHLRVTSVERHAWIDPRDGAEITVEVPREDSVVLPISFQ